jgi:hypothetical protein
LNGSFKSTCTTRSAWDDTIGGKHAERRCYSHLPLDEGMDQRVVEKTAIGLKKPGDEGLATKE